MTARRDIILTVLHDLVGRFLYYDRKDSESLPMGEIEKAVEDGDVTGYEISDVFQQHLFARLPEPKDETGPSVEECLSDLLTEADRMVSLLKDAHPGLMTWNEALAHQMIRMENAMRGLGYVRTKALAIR
jgi:hypothetical protein